MVKLNDFFASDLDKVFFNTDEFATLADVDGKSIKVIVNNEMLKKHNLKNEGEGLTTSELLFLARKLEFDRKPSVGKRMVFNGKNYKIDDISEGSEMYTIVLGRFMS